MNLLSIRWSQEGDIILKGEYAMYTDIERARPRERITVSSDITRAMSTTSGYMYVYIKVASRLTRLREETIL